MTPEAQQELLDTLRDLARQVRGAQAELQELREDRDAMAAELQELRKPRRSWQTRAEQVRAHADQISMLAERRPERDPRRALLALLLSEVL